MTEIGGKANIKKSRGMSTKGSIMTSIPYTIPVITGKGVLQIIAKMIGGYDIGSHMQEISALAKIIMLIGQSLMNFTVPAIATLIAYTMTDKPGIVPGPVMGALVNSISTGPIGGAIGGLLVGYIVIAFKKLRVPKVLSGIMLIMIMPTLTALISDLLMYYVSGIPIKALMEALTGMLLPLSAGSKFVVGIMIGAMTCFGCDGPINRTAALFIDELNADGFLIPTSAEMYASMTASLGTALATVLGGKKRLSPGEREQTKSLAILSCCYIQGGVIPLLMKDPVRVAISYMTGGVITSGLCTVTALESPAIHSGAFVIAITSKPLLFIGLWALGACVIGVPYAILRKPLLEEYVDGDMDNPLLWYNSYNTGKKECIMYVSMKGMLWNVHENSYTVMTIDYINMKQTRTIIQSASGEHSTVTISILPGQMRAHGYGDIMAPMIRNVVEEVPVPATFSLDHGTNLESIVCVMECGFFSVIIDPPSCELERNIRRTKTVTALARGVGLSCKAELGHVGMADQPGNTRTDLYTNPEQAEEFITRAHCDCLAVAVGTAHRSYPRGFVLKLDSDRLRLLRNTPKMPLVLHGDSEAGDKDIGRVVGYGVNKINICTDLLKHARRTIVDAIAADPSTDYISAYMVAQEAAKMFIRKYMRLTSSSGRYTFGKDQEPEPD